MVMTTGRQQQQNTGIGLPGFIRVGSVEPQQDGGRYVRPTSPPMADAGTTAPVYVYALGRVEPRFPTLGVEKEFVQATGRADLAGLTDHEALYEILSAPLNRYLARQLCWVFTIEGIETYILRPRDPADFAMLVEALRPKGAVHNEDGDAGGAADGGDGDQVVPTWQVPPPEASEDLDLIVGQMGPIAAPDVCNGLMVPIVVFDQCYSFDLETLIGAVPPPLGMVDGDLPRFRRGVRELITTIKTIADNAGATDDHRALNYLAVRYPGIYHRVDEAFRDNYSLVAVEERPSRLTGVRNIIDVILSFTHRATNFTAKSFVRVDTTDEFPFLASPLAPYFDR